MNKKRVVIGVLSFSLITLIIISLVLAASPSEPVGHYSNQIDFSSGIDINNRVIISPGVNSPDSGFIKFGDGTGWKLYFAKRDGTALITFTDTGRIGIGTNNPSEKLEVVGNIKASGSITIGQLCFTGGGCIS